MGSLLQVIYMALGLYMYMVFVSFVLSWLVVFNVVNTRNNMVAAISDFLYRITEPVLKPIRRVVPVINGIDLAPLALWFGIIFLRILIANNIHYFM